MLTCNTPPALGHLDAAEVLVLRHIDRQPRDVRQGAVAQ